MSTLDKESNFHFFIEPAFWFVDYQDTKFSTNPKVGYEEITTEDGKSFKIYRNQDDQISQISINENENNVSVDFLETSQIHLPRLIKAVLKICHLQQYCIKDFGRK